MAGRLLLPLTANAQRWQFDVGATSVGSDSLGAVGAVSVVPQIEWSRGALYGLLNGSVSLFERSTWAAQAWGNVSVLSRAAARSHAARFEAAASLGGSVHGDGYSNLSGQTELRAHLSNRTIGGWVGISAAGGWTTDSTGGASAVGPTVGGWFSRAPLTATAFWSTQVLQGDWFHELNARVSALRGPVDIATFAGLRSGPTRSSRDPEAWIGATVAVWVGPRSAIVASAATYPTEPLQALPRGRYISLSYRFANRRSPVWAPSWTGRTVYAPEGNDGAMLFRAPEAERVAIAGDWTGWQPIPLERTSDGSWALRPRLAPGVYRFNLVIDGTRWVVPVGFATVDDGFGGVVGLLVVP